MFRLVRATKLSLNQCTHSVQHNAHKLPIHLSFRFNSTKIDKDSPKEVENGNNIDELEDFDNLIDDTYTDKSSDIAKNQEENTASQNKSDEDLLKHIFQDKPKETKSQHKPLFDFTSDSGPAAFKLFSEESKENDISNKPKSKATSDFEMLDDFMKKEFNENEKTEDDSFAKLFESLNIGNDENSASTLSNNDSNTLKGNDFFQKFDMDSDELTFGKDFLGEDSRNPANREAFQKVFENYFKPDGNEEHFLATDNMLAKDKMKNIIGGSRYDRRSRPQFGDKIKSDSETKEALKPTMEFIEGVGSRGELVEMFNNILKTWDQKEELFFLNDLENSSNTEAINEKHKKLVKEINETSLENPEDPLINVLTLPLIFNKIFKTIVDKFNDSQLVLSLFNILKKDAKLYTHGCNQDTYNQIMKIYWIYNGKSNLYNIEMINLEMTNNGFSGDYETAFILKQCVVDYYKLKKGDGLITQKTRLPIWCEEDNKRAHYLEVKIQEIVGEY